MAAPSVLQAWRPFFAAALEAKLKRLFSSGSDWLPTIGGMNTSARSLCFALSLVLLGGGAAAGERDEAERVRAAVQAGEILPLPQLLERLQRSHPGQVLEIELEREDGRWIYEIKLLQAGGRLLKLEVDAKSGAVLKQRVRSAPASAPS